MILARMPPEIRNHIYELAFEPDADTVDLLHAQPPTKDLLLSCRQINSEAREIYREAYRGYWTQTKFTTTWDQRSGRMRAMGAFLAGRPVSEADMDRYGWVREIRDEDFLHISELVITKICESGRRDFDHIRDGIDSTRGHRVHLPGVELMLVPRQPQQALRAAGFDVSDMAHSLVDNADGTFSREIVQSHIMVTVRSWGQHDPTRNMCLTDAELSEARRIAGYSGLTKSEIVALMSWFTDGEVEEVVAEGAVTAADST